MPVGSDTTMLRFIQLLPDVPVEGNFNLKDLPGTGRRIDVLCRDLAACFDWGPLTWPKEQLELVTLLSNRLVLRFHTPVQTIPKGEIAWASVMRDALRGNPPDFISISHNNLESLIGEYNRPPENNLWILHERGEPFFDQITKFSRTQNSFMLGDHRGFDSQTEECFIEHALRKVSLGNISYLSSHCVVSIISKFERMVQ